MTAFPGYRSLVLVRATPNVQVFRATRERDAANVVLKTRRDPQRSAEELARSKTEFALGQRLKACSGVVTTDALEPTSNGVMLVM